MCAAVARYGRDSSHNTGTRSVAADMGRRATLGMRSSTILEFTQGLIHGFQAGEHGRGTNDEDDSAAGGTLFLSHACLMGFINQTPPR